MRRPRYPSLEPHRLGELQTDTIPLTFRPVPPTSRERGLPLRFCYAGKVSTAAAIRPRSCEDYANSLPDPAAQLEFHSGRVDRRL